jgi:hypothetical protein
VAIGDHLHNAHRTLPAFTSLSGAFNVAIGAHLHVRVASNGSWAVDRTGDSGKGRSGGGGGRSGGGAAAAAAAESVGVGVGGRGGGGGTSAAAAASAGDH